MLFFLRIVLLLAFVVMTSACSYFGGDKGVFRDRGSNYLEVQANQPLIMPAGSGLEAQQPVDPSLLPNSSSTTNFVLPRPYRSVQ